MQTRICIQVEKCYTQLIMAGAGQAADTAEATWRSLPAQPVALHATDKDGHEWHMSLNAWSGALGLDPQSWSNLNVGVSCVSSGLGVDRGIFRHTKMAWAWPHGHGLPAARQQLKLRALQ